MTFFHFINCVALSYVPYVITYKVSGLSEYSAHWKCVQASALYCLVQFVKMLLLATFFPETDSVGGHMDAVGDILKCSVDLTDLVGMYLIMSQLSVKGPIKFTCAGVGWAFAEFVLTRAFPFWFGARGAEFDWMYVRMSLESNVLLIQHLATATLVWLYTRRDLASTHRYAVAALMLLVVYRPVIIHLLNLFVAVGPWTGLLVHLMFVLLVGVSTLPLYGKVSNVYY